MGLANLWGIADLHCQKVESIKWLKHKLRGTLVSFSSCQWNLIKTFQIEGMIALITKMDLIFSSDLLNGQK